MIIPTIIDGICFAVPHTALNGVERIEKSKPFAAVVPVCAESAADEAVILDTISSIVSSKDVFIPSGSFLTSERLPIQSPIFAAAVSIFSNLAIMLAVKFLTSTTIFAPSRTIRAISTANIASDNNVPARPFFSGVFRVMKFTGL